MKVDTDLIEITPNDISNFNDEKYVKLSISQTQQVLIDQLISQMPTITASSELANAWTIKFPANVQGELMHFKRGGYGTAIMTKDGISGHASFYPLENRLIVLKTFSVMSVATGQYYLTKINSQLSLINQQLDRILDFLYGAQRAELLSEIGFVQYAHNNFVSIMEHDEQRIGTIASLQQARKIAMKDIEFYLQDLSKKSKTTTKKFNDFVEVVNDSAQTKETLELAMQLYVLSSLMETSFAQNTDQEYLNYTKNDILFFINKSEKRILECFSNLRGRLGTYTGTAFSKVDTEPLAIRLDEIISRLNDGAESCLVKAVNNMVETASKEQKYILSKNGNVYLCST